MNIILKTSDSYHKKNKNKFEPPLSVYVLAGAETERHKLYIKNKKKAADLIYVRHLCSYSPAL